MRFISALLVVLFVSSALAFGRTAERQAKRDTCSVYTCSGNGQTCLDTDTINYYCTSANSYCNQTRDDTSTLTSATCLAQVANGGNCIPPRFGDFSQQCQSNYCNSTSGICYTPTPTPSPKPNGQSCSVNTDCQSNICTNSVCVGKNVGESCDDSRNCNIGANDICYKSVCTNYANLGGACDPTSSTDICGEPFFCSSASSTCVAMYSGAQGSTCSFSDMCAEGLACVSGTCSAPAASSGTACTADSDCTRTGEECSCSYITGKGTCQNSDVATAAGYNAVSTAISKCYASNGPCASDSSLLCAVTKCATYYCNYLTLSNNADAAEYSRYPACFNAYSGQTADALPSFCSKTSDASVAAASTVVIAAAAAVILM